MNSKLAACFAALAALLPSASAQSECQLDAFDTGTPETYQDLVIGDDFVAVGARSFGAPTGKVLIRSTTGQPDTVLLPPGPVAGTEFGQSVDAHGSMLVVGQLKRTGNRGAVHVFERSGGSWSPVDLLVPSGSSDFDFFGWDVELEQDRLVVSAYAEGDGRVYVFERVGGVWTETAVLDTPTPGSAFGRAIRLAGDTIVCSKSNSVSSDTLHVFELVGGAWTETDVLFVPASALYPPSGFGTVLNLDFDGERIAIGNVTASVQSPFPGLVVVFERFGNAWQRFSLLSHDLPSAANFGSAVRFAGDRLFVGDFGATGITVPADRGRVEVFQRVPSGWEFQRIVTPATFSFNEQFGSRLDVSGQLLAVASIRNTDGGAFLFQLPGHGELLGTGVGGASGVPSLTVDGCVGLGGTFTLGVAGAPPSGIGILVVSNSFGAVPLFGGTLYCLPPYPVFSVHQASATGTATFPFLLDASFSGLAFHSQVGYSDVTAPGGLALGRALRVLLP